jgi:hypothetical protein
MDPIQQIVPVAPSIPPIIPTPLIGGIDRNDRRRTTDEDRRRRRQPRPADPSGAADEPHGQDDSGLHVDVTA